jgi:hypothetical protein
MPKGASATSSRWRVFGGVAYLLFIVRGNIDYFSGMGTVFSEKGILGEILP